MNGFHVFTLCSLLLSVVLVIRGEDIFHIACTNGEVKASGPIAEVHAECSKNLDPTSEKNMCEFQCIRKKEGLLDADGLPSLDKHLSYMKKMMSADLAAKAEAPIKDCFTKHHSAVMHHEKDALCDSSKGFNACLKDSIMAICTGGK